MIWGKIIGGFFGLLLGRLPGLLIGLLIGHWFDRALKQALMQPNRTASTPYGFTYTLFAVLGHLAKSKGRVTEQDIDYVSRLMTALQLEGDARTAAQDAFRDGKQADFPVAEQVRSLRSQFVWRRDLLQFFLEQLLIVALQDGQLDDAEYQVLLKVTEALGFRREQLDAMVEMVSAQLRFQHHSAGSQGTRRASSEAQLANAYAVLGIAPSASFAEVKKAYRRMMNKHHPDKLAAQGLPPEMRESARVKSQQIQAAYELIKTQLGK